MNIVPDTNVIIAAFASRGLCSSVFELCLDSCLITISKLILTEVHRVLLEKFKMPEENVKPIIKYLEEYCWVKEYRKLKENVCMDKDDDEILALAKSNSVKYIITRDNDLLLLKVFGSIKIISPRKFWEISKKKEDK